MVIIKSTSLDSDAIGSYRVNKENGSLTKVNSSMITGHIQNPYAASPHTVNCYSVKVDTPLRMVI